MANWRRRAVAVLALVVVGLAASLAVAFALSGGLPQFEYTAREVDPAADPGAVANASAEVRNLDREVARTPEIEPAIETAADRGVYEGSVGSRNHTSELYLLADDVRAEYAVYEDRYYRWNSTTRPEDDYVRIRLAPATSRTVVDDLAVPFADASPASKRLIRNRTTGGVGTPNESLVVRNGTYYAVTSKSETSVFAKLLATLSLFVLSVPGRAYLGCGLALAAFVRSGDPYPLGTTRSLAAVGLVLPVSWALATFWSGSALVNYGVIPAVAGLVALGLPLGVLLRRWRLRRVAAVVGGGLVAVAVAGGLAAGVPGAVVAVLGFALVAVAGLPLVPYGYYLTDPT